MLTTTSQNINSRRTVNQTAIAAKDATSYAMPILNAKIAESHNTTTTTNDNQIQNGIWTIENKVKGTHRTFKIHTARSGRFGQKRFVSLLIGSDNENCYEGFAFVEESGKTIRVWNRHAINADGSKSDFAKFAEILTDLFVNDGKKFGKFCELKGSTTCLRCNRALTVPSSIDNRYGKECAKKMIAGF